jgi:hypothetical protein
MLVETPREDHLDDQAQQKAGTTGPRDQGATARIRGPLSQDRSCALTSPKPFATSAMSP